MSDVADVVVIGGGSTGTSIAWQLARQGAGSVILLDKSGIATGATGWSSGVVRQHYAHETLARLALASLRVFERFGEIVGGDAGFRRTGFLVLVQPEDAAALDANAAMQRGLGIDVRVLTRDDLRRFEPRMTTGDVGAAAWEPCAGYADPVGTAAGFAAAGPSPDRDLFRPDRFALGQPIRSPHPYVAPMLG